MTRLPRSQTEQIQRASKRSAVITIAGFVVVLGTFGYSAKILGDLDSKIDVGEAHINAIESQTETLRAERDEILKDNEALQAEQKNLKHASAELEEQIRMSLKEIDELTAAKEKLAKRTTFITENTDLFQRQNQGLRGGLETLREILSQTPGGQVQYDRVVTALPIETVVNPTADARSIPDKKNFYDFTCKLEIPPQRRDEIVRVTYYFDHPSFLNKDFESIDAARGFPVSYEGWGALRQVQITLHLRNGEEAQLAFGMADAINASRDRPVGVKGPIPLRGRWPARGVPVKGGRR